MTKKRASEIEEGDVIVDRLGFLRVVVNIVTFPARVIVGLIFSDDGSEYHDFDHEIDVLDDERGY